MENQKSLIEIAYEIAVEAAGAINIYKLMEETLARKGVNDESGDLAAALYTEITTSSKFVFIGNDEWDLKSRQSLSVFEKDAAEFNDAAEYEQERQKFEPDRNEGGWNPDDEEKPVDEDAEENETSEDDDDADDTSYETQYEDEEQTSDEDLDFEDDDMDDSFDDTDEDEKRYNAIMDEYEDMYEN